MPHEQNQLVEQIQQRIARLLATNAVGQKLWLIGGFRYRFLDRSARASRDVDYHWAGDLDEKQAQLVSLFERRLLPDVRRQLGYEGDVRAAAGPDAQSPVVRIVELAFWRAAGPYGRIEVPVEITRIVCLDPPIIRTAGGVAYLTASDADMIESKVLAMVNRTVLEHRDFVDLFLFADAFVADSSQRLQRKFGMIGLTSEAIDKRFRQIEVGRSYHIGAIAAVMTEQLDPEVAANIEVAGGAAKVLVAVLARLRELGIPQMGAM